MTYFLVSYGNKFTRKLIIIVSCKDFSIVFILLSPTKMISTWIIVFTVSGVLFCCYFILLTCCKQDRTVVIMNDHEEEKDNYSPV